MNLHFPDEDFSHLVANSGELFLKHLFDKYYREFCKLSFKYVGSTAIAEDIVQDVFVNIWNKKYSLNCQGSIKPYLIKSVINASINYIKSKFARQNTKKEEIDINSTQDYGPDEELIGNELNQLVKKAIEQLPDKCRTIFMLSRFSGQSYKEIAEELGIATKTVEAQVSIALKKIQLFLSKLGYLKLSIAIATVSEFL